MKKLPLQRRTLALLAVIVPLLLLFVYVALRSGPLAPVAVTEVTVESRALTPALFGNGTVEPRYIYKIGPTFAGRVERLEVDVGDRVKAGQVLGEMDPVDLEDRIRSQESAFKSAQAGVREAEARHAYAKSQAHRYEQLFEKQLASEEINTTKQQELQIADAVFAVAREGLARASSDLQAAVALRNNLLLTAPVDGVVAVRNADPGTTVIAGQAVVEVIDLENLWINVRFDQINASGLSAGLSAQIVLRSRGGQALRGHVLRLELMADAITEEMLAKVVFDEQPETLPPIGELAEVTVELPELAAGPVIPNAAVQREGAQLGVWQIKGKDLHFTPITLGVADLAGNVQIGEGLKAGDRVIVYSETALSQHKRIHLVEEIPGVSP